MAVESAGLRQPSAANTSFERDSALDVLKGLAIIGVLFVHMSFPSRFSQDTLLWIDAIQHMFGWCVMAFFFAAGVLCNEADAKIHVRRYALKRARRLLIPCFVFSLTYKAAQIILYHNGIIGQRREIPASPLAWSEFLFVPVGPQFYFLPYLFIISLFTVLLMILTKSDRLLAWAMFIACAVFYAVATPPAIAHGEHWVLVPAYLFSFCLGLMARQSRREHQWWWLTVTGAAIIGCALQRSAFYGYVMAPVLLYWGLQKVSLPSSCELLGRKSGAIYVWHDPLLLPGISIIAVSLIASEFLQMAMIMFFGLAIPIVFGELVNRCNFLHFYRF